MRRQRIGQRVGRAEHRVLDRQAGEARAELHARRGLRDRRDRRARAQKFAPSSRQASRLNASDTGLRRLVT